MSTILCVPDIHAPFEHPNALEFVAGMIDVYEPDEIVCLGDEIDGYMFSQFDKDPDAMGATDELEMTIERLQDWYAIIPKMKICLGNHTLRYLKRATQAGLPKHLIRSVREIIHAPKGWQWADEWFIEDIRFFHGEPYGGKTAARNMLADRKQNQVHGHLHSLAGVTYEMTPDGLKWVLSCGCLIDSDTYAFRYSKRNRVQDILGCGVIVEGTPIFEALR
jgi:hypothetical protein